MRVDESATKAARERHARGMTILNLLFRFNPKRAGTPQDQRWLATAKPARITYRRARMKTDPYWSDRRRRRKRARAARKANRR